MRDAVDRLAATAGQHQLSAVAAVERASAAFDRGAWRECYELLTGADAAHLGAADLARHASAAHLVGLGRESARLWDRAHRASLEAGDMRGAVRAAFWISLGLLVRRNIAQAVGWTARANRLLDDGGEGDCVERGYLRFTEALRFGIEGDAATAERLFANAVDIATRFADRNLAILARHAQARSFIFAGDIKRGAAVLDEVLVAIEAGDVSPLFVGDIYCSAISGCREMYDYGRAREWTKALERWCESQTDAINYGGQCLVHRAEIIRMQGEWDMAVSELERARGLFEQLPTCPESGSAWYQLGEVHRLRGAYDMAEEAFRNSSRAGHDPMPGLALLRAAQGKIAPARASLRRALEESFLWPVRARLLPATIELALAANDFDTARAAAAELATLAERVRSPWLSANAEYAIGSTALAGDNPRAALTSLRSALATWSTLHALYDTACTRVLLGMACRALGDDESAALELDAARELFERLGARPDVARVTALRHASASGPLTQREVEVLRLIASGKTNRGIATALRISEKTVARHVSNIFMKLGVANRAAATTYAHENRLIEPSTRKYP